MSMRLWPLFFCLASSVACVTERFPLAPGVGSFKVELAAIDPWIPSAACASAPVEGRPDCRRPFPTQASPVGLRLHVTALDRRARAMVDYTGAAMVDVRPGKLVGVGPGGLVLTFVQGTAEVDLQIAHAFDATRVWVEECGSATEAGTFATGVSTAIWFAQPTVAQLNETTDNTTSPLVPKANNVCAISGDARYGLGPDENGVLSWVGYSHGRAVNAPPPAMGYFVDVIGCSRDDYDAAGAAGCERGPLVVTAIANEGFYVTDLHSTGVGCTAHATCGATGYCDLGRGLCLPGFNHVYAFNFNYPDELEVGDLVVSLRGSPVEFAGATQLSNPVWQRDGVRRGAELLPQPVRIDPDTYLSAVRSYGRNREEVLALEKLEGALVCMDNLAPASSLRLCDLNQSGGIERQGCLVDSAAPLPPRCDVAMGSAVRPPTCSEATRGDYCFPLSEEELTTCALSGYVPANPGEYCCERLCYLDPACTEESSYQTYGQWTAEVFGFYEVEDAAPVKIAIASRDADPDFNPLSYAAAERKKPVAERRHVRVIGNLRQVLAARPVWLIVPRTPADIGKDGELCP